MIPVYAIGDHDGAIDFSKDAAVNSLWESNIGFIHSVERR